MMAAKARLFNDHRAVELFMWSPDPSAHKRIGRGVRNFDSAAWDREKQNAVLFGNYYSYYSCRRRAKPVGLVLPSV